MKPLNLFEPILIVDIDLFSLTYLMFNISSYICQILAKISN